MTMALAVAMVACSGTAGAPGPAGPPGQDAPTPDPTTPTDPPDTGPSNDPPAVEAFKTVYLAMAGTGTMLSQKVDLNKNITDDEGLAFGRTPTSSAPTVATGTVDSAGMLTVKAVGAGSATITVTASDGINDPVTAEVPVMVVATNAKPTTNGLTQIDKDELQKVLYVSRGAIPVTVTVAIDAGVASGGVTDSIKKLVAEIGDKAKPDDNWVTVTATKHPTAPNQYIITTTPVKDINGKKSYGKSVDVKIFSMDKFGAESADALTFKANVNPIPKAVFTTIPRTDLIRNEPRVFAGPEYSDIIINDYFSDLGVMLPAATATVATTVRTAALMEGDTTCTVTTDPATLTMAVVQKLNTRSLFAANDNDMFAVRPPTPIAPDATGDDGTLDTAGENTMLKDDVQKPGQMLAAVRVYVDATNLGKDGIIGGTNSIATGKIVANKDTRAVKNGEFKITITCSDPDGEAVAERLVGVTGTTTATGS